MINTTKTLLAFAFATTTFLATICSHHVEAFGFMNKIFARKSSGYVEIISGLEMQTAQVVAVNIIDHDGVEKRFFPPLQYPPVIDKPKSSRVVARAIPNRSPRVVARAIPNRNQSPIRIIKPFDIEKATTNRPTNTNKDRPKLLAALIGAAVCLAVGGSEAAAGPLRTVMNAFAISFYGFVWFKTLRSYGKEDDENRKISSFRGGLTYAKRSGRDTLMSF